jgi:catechol 2,3-dioxygenase-like lactoylglutathione lyase family enzyme
VATIRTQGLDHFAVTVRDLERSERFYRDVLGLERVFADEWVEPVMMTATTGSGVALFQAEAGPPGARPPVRVVHVAFRVERSMFDLAREVLAELGLEPEFEDHGVAHSIYFPDPDGHRLELTTYEV